MSEQSLNSVANVPAAFSYIPLAGGGIVQRDICFLRIIVVIMCTYL